MAIALTIVFALAALQWLACAFMWIVAPRRSESERRMVVSTIALALAVVIVLHVQRANAPVPVAVASRGCANVTRGMSGEKVRGVMGAPTRVVSEADTQGPGGEAWVYEDARCVAHVLNGAVWSVDGD